MSRPSEYRPEYAEQGRKLCLLLGATDAELAAYFEVSETTINNWKLQFPEFLESIKSGKATADCHIANKLYDRASGAEWVEQQAFKVKKTQYGDNGKKLLEQEEVITVDVARVAPPDTTAAIFWLKNRASAKWRDKHELTGDPDNPLQAAISVRFV